jgi:hypothetical protein
MGERTDGDRLLEDYLRHAGIPVPIKAGTDAMQQVLKPHRTQIHAAARKLREARERLKHRKRPGSILTSI